MKLTNEFTVAATPEQTWATLLDLGRVARCLPGATLEAENGGGVYRGGMKVKLGPVTAEYTGVAELQDVDEDAHVASVHVRGREARGQGTAAATITNRVSPADGGRTRVVVETDLQVTGRAAQFGRGVMEDVAGAMLDQFAQRLEREIAGGAAATADRRVDQARNDDLMDISGAVLSALPKQQLLVGAAAFLLLLVWLLTRPKTIRIEHVHKLG